MIRAVLILLCLATPAWAVKPDEVLPDPAQEARARDLSKGLRCLVCRNENIDDSDAGLARDLRLLVRERITSGDTDAEVIGYVVARYGEYVLLRPTATGSNLILWIAGPLMLLAGAGISLAYVRRRQRPDPQTLSDDERARLAEILRE